MRFPLLVSCIPSFGQPGLVMDTRVTSSMPMSRRMVSMSSAIIGATRTITPVAMSKDTTGGSGLRSVGETSTEAMVSTTTTTTT
ncbi:unnamed protein product [Allacma fusca]|uniref:Uncharacterized protein n=1 Tax=Allacma fusca TaxID=39272 RepID=A0A8J2LHB9_9HEXA|nr:unnamed protein product [Allacma fusca]